MITVQFKSVASGTCKWCAKAKDQVYDVAFSDQSFVGTLCKNDLLRAIGLKVSGLEPERKPVSTVPAPNATAVGK